MKVNNSYTAESIEEVAGHLNSLADQTEAKNKLTHKKTVHEVNNAYASGLREAARIVGATKIVPPTAEEVAERQKRAAEELAAKTAAENKAKADAASAEKTGDTKATGASAAPAAASQTNKAKATA